MDMPTRSEQIEVPDPMTGQMVPQLQEVPAWMPNDWDRIPVWQQQLALWMKTQDYEAVAAEHPERAEVAKLMWAGLKQLEQQKVAEHAAQQQQMAQQLGMGNAAAPQGPPAQPSVPNAAGLPATGASQPGAGPGDGSSAGPQ